MLIGHSLLNRGPCIAGMALWVYAMMCWKTGCYDIVTKITMEVIPLNVASFSRIEMIELLEKFKNNASMNIILDTPKYTEIINLSQYDPTEVINMESKGIVITEILYDELVLERNEQITAMREGLAHASFFEAH